MTNPVQKLIQHELSTARLRVRALENALTLFGPAAPVVTRKKPGPKPKPKAAVAKKRKALKTKNPAKKAESLASGTHAERITRVLGSFIDHSASVREICGALPKYKPLSLRKAIQEMAGTGQIRRIGRGVYALP